MIGFDTCAKDYQNGSRGLSVDTRLQMQKSCVITPNDFYALGMSQKRLPDLNLETHTHPEVPELEQFVRPTIPTPAPPTCKAPALDNSSAPIPHTTAALVFDTETTGIGLRGVVIQLAVGFFDSDGVLLRMYDELWKLPPGRGISKEAQKVHKIDRKRVNTRGRDALPQIARMQQTFSEAHRRGIPIVAFNAAFDCRLLRQTALAHGVEGRAWTLKEDHTLCLMKRSRMHSNLRSLSGRRCGFTNASLYEHLHKCKPTQELHDAAADVEVTAGCYFRGGLKRWW